MQQNEKINRYIKTICEQVRWKKAHEVISEEIGNHITDQISAFRDDGIDEEIATDKAIKEMGDPILVGSELDHAHRPKIEWSIIALTVCILLIGFAVRKFIANDTGISMMDNSFISTILGITCMIIAYFLDFTVIGKYSKLIYSGLVFVLIGTVIVSPVVNGRYSYSQFILLFFPVAFAGIIYAMRTKGYRGILLCGVFFTVPVYMGFIISNISTVFLCSLACLILLTYAIAKGWFNVRRSRAMHLVYIPTIITTIITTIIIFLVSIYNKSYLIEKIQTALNPGHDPMGAGYIGSLIRNMIANAKFLGQGGSGINHTHIHGLNTDIVLTYLINRLGWISFIAIMIIILLFITRLYILCSRQKSVLGRLVSTSIVIIFTIEVILYVTFNLGFTMFSPLALPLISYGGIATIINMILIGIMLSVFKSDDLVRDNIRTLEYKISGSLK